MINANSLAKQAIDEGNGVLRLAPNWVPRSFCVPGRRIKLHPDDYYVLGGERGGIDERWFASTTSADNGPLTGLNEGLSAVVLGHGSNAPQVLLRDAVEELGDAVISRRWPGMIPQLVAESISKFKPAKSMHVRSVGHINTQFLINYD